MIIEIKHSMKEEKHGRPFVPGGINIKLLNILKGGKSTPQINRKISIKTVLRINIHQNWNSKFFKKTINIITNNLNNRI